MAANDFVIFDDGTYIPGSKRYAVLPGGKSPGSIKVGEFVLKALGLAYATSWVNGLTATATKPVVGTDILLGLAATPSTETASANGVVDVIPNTPGLTYLGNAANTATFGVGTTPVQATYDALVGDRVLLNYSVAGVFTVLASDSATSGVVIEPMDVTKHPGGKVRFSLRQGLNYNA